MTNLNLKKIEDIVDKAHQGGDIPELYNSLMEEYANNKEELKNNTKEYIHAKLRPIIEDVGPDILDRVALRVEYTEKVAIARTFSEGSLFDPKREAELLDDAKNKKGRYSGIPLDGMRMHDILLLILSICKERQGKWHEKIITDLKNKKISLPVSKKRISEDIRPEINPSSHMEGNELEKALEFGLYPYIDFLNNRSKHLFADERLFARNIVIAEQDFAGWLSAHDRNEPTAVVSGFNPAGRFHLGYIPIINLIKNFYDKGAEIYIPISDIEAHAIKSVSYKELYNNIIHQHLLNYWALGVPLDSSRVHIYSHYSKKEVTSLAFDIGTILPLRTLFSTFGVDFSRNITSTFFPAIQVADIIYPQISKETTVHTLVPCGVDQVPYIRRSRDKNIINKFNIEKPSILVIKYLKGLQSNKMGNKKDGVDAIYIDDDINTIRSKISGVTTGGHVSMEDHKKIGGSPELCNIFNWFEFFMENPKQLSDIHANCIKGKILCGECKKIATNIIPELVEKIKRERDKIDINEIEELENIEIDVLRKLK